MLSIAALKAATRSLAFIFMRHKLIILFLFTSLFSLGQTCDTIDGQKVNCIDSIGLKQGYWKVRKQVLLYSSDSDFGPGTGHKDVYKFIVL